MYEPDSFVPLAQAEWASPLQTFSLPEPSASQAANEKVLHDFAYFPYTSPKEATHWQAPGTNIVAPLPSFEQAQQQAVQEQQRQKANSQETGPQQWPDVLPLSSLAIKPAHPPVFKAEDVGLDETYFNKASEAKAVDGAFETTSNDETNNTPSLAKAQAIMQQLQPEEAALLAHMQASFNTVANKIKQASNDARLNPFKEPTTPPQGSAKQVRIRYYHCDQLGTPKELTSSSGELVWYAQYKAWGNTVKVEWLQGPAGQEAGFEWGQVEGVNGTGNSSSNDNSSRTIQSHKHTQAQAQVQPIRFQGQYYDWETGLHYNRFRYYDPDCGRFICKDPIGLAGGLNLFQYAPNPVGWVDPFGLDGVYFFRVGGVTSGPTDYIGSYGSTKKDRYGDSQKQRLKEAIGKNGVEGNGTFIDKGIKYDTDADNPCPNLVSNREFAYIVEQVMIKHSYTSTGSGRVRNKQDYFNERDSKGKSLITKLGKICKTLARAAIQSAFKAELLFKSKASGTGP